MNERLKVESDKSIKSKELSIKEKEIKSKETIERDKRKVERENMKNDIMVAKINARNRANKPKK